MAMHEGDRYIPRKAAAKILGISVATLMRHEEQKLPNWPAMYRLTPRTIRYSKIETERYLESKRV